jgi:hypothetical protein
MICLHSLCCCTWFPVLPPYVTYILLFYLQLLLFLLQHGDSLHLMCQISCPFSFACTIRKNSSKSIYLFVVSFWSHTQPPGWTTTPCEVPMTASDYVYSYLPYPTAFSYIWKLRTCHAMGRKTLLTWWHFHHSS